MPTYRYEAAESGKGCAFCSGGFETVHPLAGPRVERCPECGAPVVRAVCAPNIGRSRTDLDYRAKRAGFSKLRRLGKGEYEKEY